MKKFSVIIKFIVWLRGRKSLVHSDCKFYLIMCDFYHPAHYLSVMMLRCATIRKFDLSSGEKLPVQRSSWKRQVSYTGVPSQKGGFHLPKASRNTLLFVNGSDRQMLLILQGENARTSSKSVALLPALGTLDTPLLTL